MKAEPSQTDAATSPPRVLPPPDTTLLPDDQLRLVGFVFRLPRAVPISPDVVITLVMGGDLGDRWNIERMPRATTSSGVPKDGVGADWVMNLRVPFVSLRLHRVERFPSAETMLEPLEPIAVAALGKEPATPGAPKMNLKPVVETVVEAVTQAARETDEGGRDMTTAAFDRCVLAVNRVLLGYGISMKDTDAGPISPGQLDTFALARTRPLDGGFDSKTLLYILNMSVGVPAPGPVLSPSETANAVRTIGLLGRGHPFLAVSSFALSSARAHRSGDYTTSVLTGATGYELMLNTVLRMLAVEEGRPEQFAEIMSARRSLSARLNADYAGRLRGGRWDTRNPATPIGAWWAAVQPIRGRIVHGGYEPTREESRTANRANLALEAFLDERFAELRYAYPKTVLTKLGPGGLAARGLLSARMRRLADELRPTLPAFWLEVRAVPDAMGP